MPKYDYVALDQKGNETKGSIEAASQNEAIGRVKDMGSSPRKSSRPTRRRTKRPPAKKPRPRPRPRVAKKAAR